jgi:hypothetical protein
MVVLVVKYNMGVWFIVLQEGKVSRFAGGCEENR